jgi:hypothetical protein
MSLGFAYILNLHLLNICNICFYTGRSKQGQVPVGSGRHTYGGVKGNRPQRHKDRIGIEPGSL